MQDGPSSWNGNTPSRSSSRARRRSSWLELLRRQPHYERFTLLRRLHTIQHRRLWRWVYLMSTHIGRHLYIPLYYHDISNTYITRQKALARRLLKNLPVENRPPISIMVPMVTLQGSKSVLHMFCVDPAILGMYLLHLLPLLALGLSFFNS